MIINRKLFNLSNNENLLLDYIENNTEEFCSLNISELSQKLFLSGSTITRLTHKLNFRTLMEFKVYVSKWSHVSKFKETDGNLSTITKKKNTVFNYYYFSIEKNSELLSTDKIKRTVTWIYKLKKILTFGIHSSYLSALHMANDLNSMGFMASAHNNIHNLVLSFKYKNPKGFVVLIYSKTMNRQDINVLLEILRRNKIKSVLITENTLIQESEDLMILPFQTLRQQKRVNALSSRISQMYINDVILKVLEESPLINKNQNLEAYCDYIGLVYDKESKNIK